MATIRGVFVAAIHVSLQSILWSERLPAHRTHKFVTTMTRHVNGKLLAICEPFRAVVTFDLPPFEQGFGVQGDIRHTFLHVEIDTMIKKVIHVLTFGWGRGCHHDFSTRRLRMMDLGQLRAPCMGLQWCVGTDWYANIRWYGFGTDPTIHFVTNLVHL